MSFKDESLEKSNPMRYSNALNYIINFTKPNYEMNVSKEELKENIQASINTIVDVCSKQAPKPVKETNAGETKLYFCPSCNKGHMVNKYQKYCEECGQKLGW